MGSATGAPLLEVSGLCVSTQTARGQGKPVDNVSFEIYPGEVLGLIGESGSGKSLTCLSVLRLNPSPATEITAGTIRFEGSDLLSLDEEEMRRVRGRRIAMVLQDPMTALNPVLTIGDQMGESLSLHRGLKGAARTEEAIALLGQLKVPEPGRVLKSYPHQISGGMRQRVVSAIALSGRPSLIIADEPTTALDVTVQAAYLSQLRKLQAESRVSVLFVTHDLGVIARICDRVAVMYGGRIVEIADVSSLFRAPQHPYTQALLRAMPNVAERAERLEAIPGQPPTLFASRECCMFAPRCLEVRDVCQNEVPTAKWTDGNSVVSCWARSNA